MAVVPTNTWLTYVLLGMCTANALSAEKVASSLTQGGRTAWVRLVPVTTCQLAAHMNSCSSGVLHRHVESVVAAVTPASWIFVLSASTSRPLTGNSMAATLMFPLKRTRRPAGPKSFVGQSFEKTALLLSPGSTPLFQLDTVALNMAGGCQYRVRGKEPDLNPSSLVIFKLTFTSTCGLPVVITGPLVLQRIRRRHQSHGQYHDQQSLKHSRIANLTL